MSGPMGRYAYNSDDGNTYSIRLDASNAAAAGLTADTTSTDLPGNYHPRYVLATHPTRGDAKKIVCGSADDALFVGPTAGTISLVDSFVSGAPAATYNVRSRIGEKRYAR